MHYSTSNADLEIQTNNYVTLLMLSHVVTSKPFIESFPKDTTAIEGTRAEFPVKVSGTPDPQLIWYYESTLLDNDYAHEISTDGSLTIVTTEMTHSGSYRLHQQCWKNWEALVSATPEEQTQRVSACESSCQYDRAGQYVAESC